MREKIKNWLHSNRKREYVITNARQLGWTVYLMGGSPKKVRVLGPGVLVKRYDLLNGCYYTREVKQARIYRMFFGELLMRWLQWCQRNRRKKRHFRLVPVAHAAFIQGITGPVIRGSEGVISMEN